MKEEHQIFTAAVQISNQEECDIAREICERYELPMWKDVDFAFDYVDYENDDFVYLKYSTYSEDEDCIGFYIDDIDEENDNLNIMSIEEFEALCEDYNPQYKSVDDILVKLKELNNLLNNK